MNGRIYPGRKFRLKSSSSNKESIEQRLRGNVKQVHRLQRLLTKSWYARCLAVRRVTQENQGKKTDGVDGVKSLTPRQRLEMVEKLALKASGLPTRRVFSS
jgi:RNA-directed DNA polymerase